MRERIKKHYQTEQYPTGDCFRTCFACILNKENVEEIPNFMKFGEKEMDNHFYKWLKLNNFEYIEVSLKEWMTQHYLPDMLCVVIIKNEKHAYGHAVVGRSYREGGKRYIELLHNPQRGQGVEDITSEHIISIGFLFKRIMIRGSYD